MKKRVLSILLVLVMLLGILPTAALADSTTADPGVVFTKTLVEDTTGNQPDKIRLEAYTTGAVTSSTAKIPADIVLVLDQSGSMDESMGNSTKLAVMKNAVETFVSDVAAMNDATGSLYRVAIVGFASESGYNDNTEVLTATKEETVVTGYDYQAVDKANLDTDETYYIQAYNSYTSITYRAHGNNPGWYTRNGRNPIDLSDYDNIYARVPITTTETSTGVAYNDLQSSHYASALVNCTDDNITNGIIGGAIAALDGEGATRTDLGMAMAHAIFDAQPAGTYANRSKIVVLITDGVPTTQSDFSTSVANSAVSHAAAMKNGGAKIFSMYMGTPSTQSANFLQACSSNYPNATAYNDLGEKAADSYYSAYTDASAIQSMFSGIASSIVANSTLNEQSVVQDILSESFQLAADVQTTGTSQIEVYTVEKTQTDWAAAEVPFANAHVTIGGSDNKTVSVTGFNFGAHCVTASPKDGPNGSDYGRKLVIYIPITEDPSSTSFGGWLQTNAGAYIYQKAGDTQPVITANPAYDSTTIRYSLTAAERAFHVDGTQLSDLVDFTFKIGDIAEGILKEMITKIPDGYNNAGVNMEYRLWYIGDKEMSESDTATDGTSDDELVAELTAPVVAGTAVDVTNPDNWTLKTNSEVKVTIPANEYMAKRVYVLVCKLTSTEPVANPDSLTVYAYLGLSVVRGDLAHIVYGEIDAGGKTTVPSGADGSLVGNTYTEAVTEGNKSAAMTFKPNAGYRISKITYFDTKIEENKTPVPFDTPIVIFDIHGEPDGSVDLDGDGVADTVTLNAGDSWSFTAHNVTKGVAVEVETERIYHTLTTSDDDGSEIIAGMTYAHENATMNVPFQALPGNQLVELTVNKDADGAPVVYDLTSADGRAAAEAAGVVLITEKDANNKDIVVGGRAIVSKTQDNDVKITSARRSYKVELVYMVEDIVDPSTGYPTRFEVQGPTAVVYGTKISDTIAPTYWPGTERTINNHNYTLSDWYTVKNQVVNLGAATMPAEDLTVYALWTRNPDVKVADVTIEKVVVGTHTEASEFNFVAVFHEQEEGTAAITIPANSEKADTAKMEIVMTDRQADLFHAGNGHVYIYELIPDAADGWIYDETVYELRWIREDGATEGTAVLFCDGEPMDDLTAVFTNERSRSAVEMSKEADKTTAKVGEVITYTVTVENTGNVDLTNVQITDTLTGIVFTNTNDVTFANGVFTVRSLPVGAVQTIVYTYTVTADDEGKIIANEVTVNVDDDTDNDDKTETKVEKKSVDLSKAADKTTAKVGEVITYTVTVKNTGNVALENLEITDSLAGIKFTDTNNVTYADGKFTVKVLAVGATETIEYTYTVTEDDVGKTVKNAVVANVPDDKDDDNETETKVENPSVELTKTADKTEAKVGDTITYTVTVENTGNVALENLEITDSLAGIKFTDTNNVTYANGKFTVKVLDETETVTFSYTYVVKTSDEGRNLVNTVVALDEEEDVIIPVGEEIRAIQVTKEPYAVNGKTTNSFIVNPGDVVTWAITIKNTGTIKLDNVFVVDTLTVGDKEYELTVFDGLDEDAAEVAVIDLDVNQVVTLYASYKAVAADAGKKLSNHVVVVATDNDEDPTNNPTDDDINDDAKVEQPGGGHLPQLNKQDHVAYIIGYEDDTVRPEKNITRAEVATIFFRLLTDESRSYYWSQTNSFSDVSKEHWFNNAISTMANAGIVNGYPDGTFRPNAPITRAEFAAIAARFSDVIYDGKSGFSDVLATHWAYDEIALAQHLGWINGYPDNTFRPDQYITRAEAMTLINRVLERAVEEEHMLPDMITWVDNRPDAWYYEAVQEATNSHTYVRTGKLVPGQGFYYEDWIVIVTPPDWAALEKTWSKANDH